MKRFILLVAVTVLAVLAFCTAAGAAGRTYDNADLRGTYYFVTMQVRMTYPPGGTEAVAEHCSGYGTVTFDGIGSVVITSTDRCSIRMIGPYPDFRFRCRCRQTIRPVAWCTGDGTCCASRHRRVIE